MAAKGYPREPAANVNGLTFHRISHPGFMPTPKNPADSLDDFIGCATSKDVDGGHIQREGALRTFLARP
jgi:hypothetical protein